MIETTEFRPPYSDAEALDESVLMLVRKVRRMAPEILSKLTPEMRETLMLAESRADRVRLSDQLSGIPLCTRPFPNYDLEDVEDETDENQ